jgi:hypothetical protein
MVYPRPSVLATVPTTTHRVAGELHGGGGGAGTAVLHPTFIHAVKSSVAEAVVQVASTCHGATQDTTRHTIRPMQSICWLHWP